MYIKEFTLQQHTPIIHFQGNETGATLRASEVKPKLDRFIIKELGGFEKVKAEHPEWFANKRHRALDYALSFLSINYQKVLIEENHKNAPMYFGNMGEDTKDKHLVFSEGVKGKIACKDNPLLSEITSKLPEFFFRNNFGTRQSKGYGSFTLKNSALNPKVYKYHFSIDNLENNIEEDYKKIMSNIDWFYQSLRSGFNLNIRGNRIYLKPAIFHYLNKNGIVWDKRSIKEAYFNNNIPKNRKNHKDLFGLSTTEKWGRNLTITKKDVQKTITRFKSPILFKPIYSGNSAMVYFDYFEPEYINDYRGSKFNIQANERSGLVLEIPNDFNFDVFFNHAFSNDLGPLIEGGDNGFPKTLRKALIAIYSQLQKQLS
ncbi:MAG: hypothetical protein CSA95_07860 [Bacteroidetes bacterium]|nr:MAG: hypothetical protein CSA95_07860 [Bacteroidota bacterium]